MQTFEVYNIEIDIIKRLDFNFWNPKKVGDVSGVAEVKSLKEWAGMGSLTASAFYPAITPFYQTKDNSKDTIPFIRVEDTRKLLLSFDNTVFLDRELLDSLSSAS